MRALKPVDKKQTAGLLFLALLLVCNAVFLYLNAFRHFNLLDMGGFLDAGWRVYKGQRPYIDFIYYTGPLYLYLNALSFHIFGFGKTAILANLVAVHSSVIILVFFMLFRKVPLYITLAVTALTMPSFYWSVSFPWHDQTAHLFGIIGLSLLVWKLPFKNTRQASYAGLACGVLCVLAFITKSNLGLAYGLAFFAVLLSAGQAAGALLGFAAGLLAGGIVALGLIRFPAEYLDQTLAYSQYDGRKRLLEMLSPANWFLNYYWLTALLVSANFFLNARRARTMYSIFLGATFVGIFSVNTGGMIKEANNILWGVQIALAFIVLYALSAGESSARGKYCLRATQVFLLIMTVVLTAISVQYGLKLKAWTYGNRNPLTGKYALESAPLQGWMAYRMEGEAIDQIVRYIKTDVPASASLLNLTDMYIIYALTGRDSYRGVPFMFINDILPAPGKQREQVRATILANLPDWLIIHMGSFDDELRYLGITQEIKESYVQVLRAQFYLVLKRR